MSARTSNRVKKPSSRLLETRDPGPSPAAESSSTGASKRRGGRVKKEEGSEPPASPASGRSKRKDLATTAPPGRIRGRRGKAEEPEEVVKDEEDGGDEEEEEDDPDKVYCVCKKTEGGRKMIECENCHDWFHFKCVGLTMTQVGKIHQYICPLCHDASEHELSTILRSDISLLPSPPRSTSPDPQPNPKSKRGKGKIPGKPSTENDEKLAKPNGVKKAGRKSDVAKGKSRTGRRGKPDAFQLDGSDHPDEEDETVDGSTKKGSFRSTPSNEASTNEASSGDDGSEYGNGGGEGDARDKKRGKEKVESGSEGKDSDGSSQGAPEQPDLAMSPSSPKQILPKPTPTRKRKSTPSTSDHQPSKVRKVSSSNANSRAESSAYSEWSPLRDFCLKKLQGTLRVVIILHRKARAEAEERTKLEVEGSPVEGREAAQGDADLKEASGSLAATVENDAMKVDNKETTPVSVEVDEVKATSDAEVYAKAVETTLYTKYKELMKPKLIYQAGQAYKQQYNLLSSALEKNLRPDLAEGISSGRIPPQDFAVMNSRDLATADALEQILKTEAELLRTTVRLEDETGPARYTKTAMEDAEMLQQIEKAVAKQSSGRRESLQKAPEEMEVDEPALADDSMDDDSARPQEKGEDHIDKSPVSAHTTPHGTPVAPPPSRPAPAPLITPAPARPSFSLTAALHGSSTVRRPSDNHFSHTEAESPFEDLPDFMQTTPALGETPLQATGGDDDYFTGEQPKAVEVKQQGVAGVLAALPVVWSGEIRNPAQSGQESPLVDIRQVGGPDQGTDPELWARMFKSSPLELVGRVAVYESAKYLTGSRFTTSKTFFIVAITPGGKGTDQEALQRERLKSLVDFHLSRDRHGVMKPHGSRPSPGMPQEIYFVPLHKADKFDFVETLDRCLLPATRDEDMILGVFICPKPKQVEPAVTAEPPPPVIPLGPGLIAPVLPYFDPQQTSPITAVTAPRPDEPIVNSAVPAVADIQALLASLKPQGIPPPLSTVPSIGRPPLNGLPVSPSQAGFSSTQHSGPLPGLPPSSGQDRSMAIPIGMPPLPRFSQPGPSSGMPFLPPPPGLTHRAPPQPGPSHQGIVTQAGVSPSVKAAPPVHPSRLALVNSPPAQQAQFMPRPSYNQQPYPSHQSPPQRYAQPRPPPKTSGYGAIQGFPGQRSPQQDQALPPQNGYRRDGYGPPGAGYGQGQGGGGNEGRGGGRR